MRRGGKNKKNKHTEKEDVDISSLSVSDREPSTSQSSSAVTDPPPQVEAPPAQVEAPPAQVEAPPAQVAAPSTKNMPRPQEEEEEPVGLGLGLGGKTKKRPRKKKKETEPTKAPEPVAAPEPIKAAVHKEVVETPGPGLSATMPKSAGRGWGPVRSPLDQPQQPPLGFTLPTAQYSAPTLTTPTQPTQPPSFGQHVGRGRGRGQSTSEPAPNVGTISAPVSRPYQTLCRFKIPDKKIGNAVTALSRPIRIMTNYLEMRIQPIKICRYDVTIKPERPKKLIPKVFVTAKDKHFPKIVVAFDQKKNCYSITPLWPQQDDRKNFTIEILDDNDAKMKFEVIIKFTGVVDLGTITTHMKNGGSSLNTPMEAIQCVDVILQQGTLQNYVKAGRQFFKRPRIPIDLGDGLEMWTGLFQSAIFTSRAFINIDVAHKGFPRQQPLIEALVKDFRLDPNRPLDNQRGVENFQLFLKGLRVNANIAGGNTKREYVCNSLLDVPSRVTFTYTNAAGEPTKSTVQKYFEVEKKCRIRYPNLNCVWVGHKDKTIYYPMEFLEVAYGQALNKQLNDNQLRTMVQQAATPPSDRIDKIKEVISNMNYSGNPCFKHFKMEVANSFFQVNAKVLPAPKLDVGAGRPIEPRRGAWQANRFLKASALDSWGIIAVEVDSRRCDCGKVIEMLKRVGGSMGMVVREPKMINFNTRISEIHRALLLAQEKEINMLVVVVTTRYKDAYDKVKRIAELEVGIITQCIKDTTAANRMNDQTAKNILLKINSKLMGINQVLEPRSIPACIREGGVMVLGADVTHPSPDQSNIPSIAAVSASMDAKCFSYNIELSIQTPKHEIIVEFEDMVFDHLTVYKKNQNALPRKIFVFRDGVSEGQFAQVMNSELVAVHNAYRRLEQRWKPEILFLLVQKRHHTRFFLGENNPQNVEPGTVVDTDIVHVRELDFYLVSHQAIKGTARPTRYHVVCNDGNIPSDEVEQLAYYLCHLYARCMRSVSYPAPTYYAHLACLRARALTSEKRFNNADLEKKPERLRVLDKMLKHSRMFFV